MLKFNNKRDVDRHVTQMTRNLNENERSSRGYSISKIYAKVYEYDIARDWLQRYLDIKTEDSSAHRFMGDLYEHLKMPEDAITSYQRSYILNSKQNDLIKIICRLFLASDCWSSNPGKVKYWTDLADTENIRDDNVLSLRNKMLNKDKNSGGKPAEEKKETEGRHHDIGMRVEKDQKNSKFIDLSGPFNDDFDFYNTSQNGHADDDIYHNASSTSFRGRRDMSVHFNEKFQDVEALVRKLSDLVVSVKDDVLSVRNDITDMNNKLLHIRGDVADLAANKDATTAKALSDVYKAIEDLSWNVSYIMNFVSNPAAGTPLTPIHQQRFPQNQMQAQLNQMYNTAYPVPAYPMQYPTPAMMQRPPPTIPGQMSAAQMAYDPMGQNLMMNPLAMQANAQQKSSLIDALNAPSLLSTWNSTYNQQQAPMTPPNFVNIAPPAVQSPAPIQNKFVEKAPPVNVVITSSDPLPAQNSFVSQPTLSVTIPPQHIKHAPQPIFSHQPIVSSSVSKAPQYENISPAKLDTSGYLEEPADYDPRPDFKPIIPLPAEVEVKTGEENEDVMFSERCKLFRFTEKEWKERGIGNIKILKNKDTGKFRILMRREQIHKLCANHAITSELELKMTEKETQLIWAANDFSDEQMQLEKFLVRFKHIDQAKKFKEKFEEAKKLTPKTPTQEKTKEPLKTKHENVKVKPATPIFSSPLVSTPSTTTVPAQKSTFQFGGLTGSLTSSTGLFTTPEPAKKDKSKDDKTTPAAPSPFANFSFGQGSTTKSFSELFGNLSSGKSDAAVAESTPVNLSLNKATHEEDEVEHYEPNAHFEPVIPLPALIDAKTGEEEENVIFVHRAKLLRYDNTTKEWKDRGIGEMKVLVHKTDASKARLLMRREQIFKLCCNMVITKDLKFKKMNTTTYSFGGQDFSEAEMKAETLAVKFKTTDLVTEFLDAVRDIQMNLDEKKEPETTKVPEKKKDSEKKTEGKGFGDAFKPKVGSWTCEACYITNKADVLYCVACESPKDDTVPKKEAKSALAPAVDAPKFNFGMPAASGFSFGMPATQPAPSVTQPVPAVINPAPVASQLTTGFLFGSTAPIVSQPLAVTSSFSFGNSVSDKPAVAKSFSFGFGNTVAALPVPAPASAVETPTDATEKPGFNFVFKKKSPSKGRSPGKSRNDSVNSEGAEEEEDDYCEEENQTYFTPVIALPEKIDIKTGEEDEEVLYCHRAKLFRFADKEWKERGLGDIKILKHKDTGKLRVVMRREQIFKICLNFFLIDDIELKRKEDNSLTFAAVDFSEGQFEPTSFAIRFKNKEIAEEFKKAIEDALAGISNGTGEKQDGESDEKSLLVKKLMLPENFYDYLKSSDCPGCIGCRPEEFIFTVYHTVIEKELPNDPPMLKTKPKPRRQSVDKHVSFKLAEDKETNENETLKKLLGTGNVMEKTSIFGGGIRKSEGTTNIFAAFNSENPPQPTSAIFGQSPASIFGNSENPPEQTATIFGQSPASIFGNSENPPQPTATIFGQSPASIFGATNDLSAPSNSIFSSSLNTTPAVVSAADSSTTFGVKPTEPFSGGLFGSKSNFSFNSGENIFGATNNKENGETANKAIGAFSSTPVFGSSVFTTSKTAETVAPAKTGNIFGSGLTSSFSFAEAAKELDKPKDSAPVVPDFIQKSNDVGGFAALAANATPEKTWAAAVNSTPPGGFFGLTVKNDFFSKNLSKANNPDGADTSQNDEAATTDDNYDPHYDPIISLPDEIHVSTGEEEEEKIFGERAKLFRYDANTKEWKERGVGEIKILHHTTIGSYRLVLRREQIFKLVLNQPINNEFHMSPMNNSPKAFCWAGMNFAESPEKAEQLAIRFKNEDLATAFNKKINECLVKLEARESLKPEND